MKYFAIFLLIVSSLMIFGGGDKDIILLEPIIITQSNQHLDFKDQKYVLGEHANCPMLIIGSIEQEPSFMVENIVIENLILDGNHLYQDYEIWCDYENYIRNNGISIRHCKNVTIRKCVIMNARSGNIVIEKDCQNITIEQCVISRAFFDGIAGYVSNDCIIRDNIIIDNHAAGISIDLQFNRGSFTNNHITGNHIGVFLRYCDDNSFVGNFIKNKEFDLYLNQVDDHEWTLPKNNTFVSNYTIENFIRQQ